VRNGGEYLKECVNSILSQTYAQFNFFVLNNNSSDGTLEWLRSLKDDRIIIKNADTDLSMPDNWARALELPLDGYITFIGHDDRLHPNYLKEMNELINAHPLASLYQAHFNYIDEKGDIIRPCKPMPEKLSVAGYLKGQFLRSTDSMGTGFLFHSKDFKKLGGYDYSIPNLLFSDYKLYAQLTGLSYQAISSQTCFDYRVHNSLSKSTNINSYRLAFEKYMLFLSEYQKDHSAVREVIQNDAPTYLQYYCRSLSHRLLKSNTSSRIKVGDFVRDCIQYAAWLGISEKFAPYTDISIRLASLIDSNTFSRSIYQKIRSIFAK
jgi:glycosyltransferase involved in cell wall biosynthesis